MIKKYQCEARVIFGDTDAMGIAYHGNYARWFEMGRTEFLRQIGFPYSELEKQDFWLPVTELHCRYRQPAVYDDVLDIRAWMAEMKGATVVMEYEVYRKTTGELLVTGSTKHAVTNSSLQPVRIKKQNPRLYQRLMEDREEEAGGETAEPKEKAPAGSGKK